MDITVVTGPPCAGKTVYVKTHAQPNDVIIDFDEIANVLGSPVTHGHDTAHVTVATAARRAAIDACLRHVGINHPVWIVDSKLHPMRKRIYHAAGARIVTLTADPAELHRRATEAGRPDTWHALIDAWPATPDGPHTVTTHSRPW